MADAKIETVFFERTHKVTLVLNDHELAALRYLTGSLMGAGPMRDIGNKIYDTINERFASQGDIPVFSSSMKLPPSTEQVEKVDLSTYYIQS